MRKYFKQEKKIEKPKPSKGKSTKAKAKAAATEAPQDECDEGEKLLREFDMNMKYGPCTGLSRPERWKRAEAWGLDPPKEVEALLESGSNVRQQCLWSHVS